MAPLSAAREFPTLGPDLSKSNRRTIAPAREVLEARRRRGADADLRR
jgi:hypothetical protein